MRTRETMSRTRKGVDTIIVAAALATILAINGCAGAGHRDGAEGQIRPATVAEIAPSTPEGYLAPNEVPDSLALLPRRPSRDPPPLPGTKRLVERV
jgi:hypothetical protein